MRAATGERGRGGGRLELDGWVAKGRVGVDGEAEGDDVLGARVRSAAVGTLGGGDGMDRVGGVGSEKVDIIGVDIKHVWAEGSACVRCFGLGGGEELDAGAGRGGGLEVEGFVSRVGGGRRWEGGRRMAVGKPGHISRVGGVVCVVDGVG